MDDYIAEKMLKRINDRLHWAQQQRSYYLGVLDALEKIKATKAISTGHRKKRVDLQMQAMDIFIWDMTFLLACYLERKHHPVWDECSKDWMASEEHRKSYKAGYKHQMERVK